MKVLKNECSTWIPTLYNRLYQVGIHGNTISRGESVETRRAQNDIIKTQKVTLQRSALLFKKKQWIFAVGSSKDKGRDCGPQLSPLVPSHGRDVTESTEQGMEGERERGIEERRRRRRTNALFRGQERGYCARNR